MSNPSLPPSADAVEAAKERLALYVAEDVTTEYMRRENEILTNLDDDIRILLAVLAARPSTRGTDNG